MSKVTIAAIVVAIMLAGPAGTQIQYPNQPRYYPPPTYGGGMNPYNRNDPKNSMFGPNPYNRNIPYNSPRSSGSIFDNPPGYNPGYR